MDAWRFLIQLVVFLIAPLAIGLLRGVDRKLTARMQNRRGPPLLQPFYDMVKLFAKDPMLINNLQVIFAGASLLFQAAALALFVAGGDLLIAFFVSGAGSVFLVLGAFTARSPYSYLGAQRELLAILAYEPILFLAVLSIGLQGSFLVSEMGGGLLLELPLVLLALIPVLVILLEKSPYDIPAAHQELISGPYIEYSGPYLAIMEGARWFQLAFVLGILTLFIWSDDDILSIIGKAAIVLSVLFLTIVIDNTTARLTRERMVTFMMTVGISLVAVNLIFQVLIFPGVA